MPLPIYQNQAKSSYLDDVKNIVLVGAGKGGVGKSTLSVELAFHLAKKGLSVGLLDADLYGPSLGRMLSLDLRPKKENDYLVPGECYGFKLMTMAFFREAALVARAPILNRTLNQFMHKVKWGRLDILLVDLPPGTGDIPLTLSQSVSLKGALLITTPQKVACDDVEKAGQLFKQVNVPLLGVVENLSYMLADDGKKWMPFGSGGAKSLASKWKVPLLAEIAIDERISRAGDEGVPYSHKYPDAKSAKSFELIASALKKNLFDKEHFLSNFYMEWKEIKHASR